MKQLIKTYFPPFAIWYALFALDQLTLIRMVFFDLTIYGRIMESYGAKYILYLIIEPACYAFLCVAFMIFLGKYRWILIPIYVYVFLIEVLEVSLLVSFKTYFLSDLLLIALNSSKDEITEFIGAFLSARHVILFGVVAIIGYLTAWITFRRSCWLKFKQRVCLFAVLCVPFVFLNVCYMPAHLILKQMLCTYFITDTIRAYERNVELLKASCDPSPYGDVTLDEKEGVKPFGVIAIGESMTRNNMQVYGYARETTPQMCSLADGNLFVFSDVLASWSNTQRALQYLLTEKDLKHCQDALCVFPEVCRRAGYHCVLFSNQGRWGCFNTLNTVLFSSCHEKRWIQGGGHLFDVDMVKMLECVITGMSKVPVMAFLHLHGSHYPYVDFDRASEKFPEELVDDCNELLDESQRRYYNRYDNTIEMTDRTFAGLVELVKSSHRPGFVMLISDHGETPREKGMRITTSMDLWEIPMVIWISDKYKECYPEVVQFLRTSVAKKLQQDQLFVGMLTLSRIRGYLRYDMKRDFLSPSFVPRRQRLICNGKETYFKDK